MDQPRYPFKTTRSTWRVTVSYNDLLGVESTLDDVRALLSTIPRLLATLTLTQLGLHLDPDDSTAWMQTERQLFRPYLLAPSLLRLVNSLDETTDADDRVVFFRQQILHTLRLAQLFCKDAPHESAEVPKHFHALGEALLRVTDLLFKSGSDLAEGGRRHMAAVLMPLYAEANPAKTIPAAHYTYQMLTSPVFTQNTAAQEALAAFQARIGLSAQDYMRLIAFVLSLFHGQRRERTESVSFGYVFERARDATAIRKAVERLSVGYMDLPAEIAGSHPQQLLADVSLEPFRSRPLIRLPSGLYWCTDLTALALRLSAGILWMLIEELSGKKREDLMRAWGYAFEDQLHARLRPLLGSRYRERPTDKLGNEITDALVDYVDDVVLMEFKASTIREKEKYGHDADTLFRHIEDKFLVKHGKRQVAEALRKLFGLEERHERSKDLLSRPPKVVYPVLICLDPSMTAPETEHVVGNILAEQIAKAGLPDRPRIERLTILTREDVELLVPILRGGAKLNNLLRERFQLDREARNTFHNFLSDVCTRMRIEKPGKREEYFELFWKDVKIFLVEQGID